MDPIARVLVLFVFCRGDNYRRTLFEGAVAAAAAQQAATRRSWVGRAARCTQPRITLRPAERPIWRPRRLLRASRAG